MFDKKRCISNIYFLAKNQGKKIGDIEKQAGVSAGYISRINKDDSNTNPGIEFLNAVAYNLGVTVDALMNYDFETLTATQLYMVNFINRLMSRTLSQELKWKRETEKELNWVSLDEDGKPTHPLYALEERSVEPEYCSRFFTGDDLTYCGERYIPVGDGYNASIGENATVYLMKVKHVPQSEEDEILDKAFYELYLVCGDKVEPLCNSVNYKGSPFTALLPELYGKIVDIYGQVNIRQNVRDVIDAFMCAGLPPADVLPFD